jgi:hypothetical protein
MIGFMGAASYVLDTIGKWPCGAFRPVNAVCANVAD